MNIFRRVISLILVLVTLAGVMSFNVFAEEGAGARAASGTGTYTITVDVLNVRSQPNTSSRVIGKLYLGQQVNVTELSSEWGKISYNGNTGWICLDYASLNTTNKLRISSKGLTLIKNMEGYRQYKYWDNNHYSIGYGTTCDADDYPNGITEAEASSLLVQALATHEVTLDAFLAKYGITVTQYQYDALVSFTFNLGNPWVKYDSFLLKDLLIDGASKYTEGAIRSAFLQFTKAGGVQLSGLVTRRNLEADLFISGINYKSSPFADVKSYHWFFDAVRHCYSYDIVNGVSKEKFDPNAPLTRAMMVTILAGISDIDTSVYKKSSFTDVRTNAWYAPYVQWAYEKGIVSGTGNGCFSPNAPVTKQDMAVMLYNYTKSISKLPSSVNGNLYKSFGDYNKVSSYAVNAMNWAISTKCISGDSDNKLYPTTSATRAQVAQVACMYTKNILAYK